MEQTLSFLNTFWTENSQTVIVALVAIAGALIAMGIMGLVAGGPTRVEQRLRTLSGREALARKGGTEREGTFNVSWLVPVAKLIMPKQDWQRSRLHAKLVRGGFFNPNAVNGFLGSKVLLMVILGGGSLFFAPFLLTQGTAQVGPEMATILVVAFVVLVALVGFYLPDGYLGHRTEARQLAITEGFPDALDMMMVCVEAGMGLDAAIARVGEEVVYSTPALGEEFRLLSLELRAGKSRGDALRAFSERTGVEAVQSLVTVLIQAERFGTSVAVAMREFANEMRTKRIQIAREKANKLPVKLIFPILMFIFPALFLVILGPAAVQIYRVLIKGALGG